MLLAVLLLQRDLLRSLNGLCIRAGANKWGLLIAGAHSGCFLE
jgi:hypothetical protein